MNRRPLRRILRERWFRRLYATRLVSQFADGIFQASLASAVFFNPDHQTDPRRAAAGFAVLLAPYSLVGPFAGVLLDRWRRRQVLVYANLARAALVLLTALLVATLGARGTPFYLSALAALSVNRFYLAALSAALPHVVDASGLVAANSLATTSGTLVTIVGGGAGLVVRHLIGTGDHGSGTIAAAAGAVYLLAAGVAALLPVALLGPDAIDRTRLTYVTRRLVAGLVAGAGHVARHRHALRALAAISATRVLFGISTIATLLLYRNYFHGGGVLRAGLVGLGQAFAAGAVGYVVAAAVTPAVTARIGKPQWMVWLFAFAALDTISFGLPFARLPLLIGAAGLGFTAQASKICVDTIVQEDIDDDYRGRVFSFYDSVFNLTFVVAAVIAAFALPSTGRSSAVLIAIALGYAATAVGYAAVEPVRGTMAVEPARATG